MSRVRRDSLQRLSRYDRWKCANPTKKTIANQGPFRPTLIYSFQLLQYANGPQRFTLDMPRTAKPNSPRVQEAAELLANNPNLTDRQAMLASEYTPDRIKNDKAYADRKRKQIHRQLDKIKLANKLPLVVEESRSQEVISDVTDTTDATSQTEPSTSTSGKQSQSTKSKKLEGIKKIRKTSSQAQQHRTNEKLKRENHNNAVKAATTMFAQHGKNP